MMKWNSNQLRDVLKISEEYISLLDPIQYKYAALHSYPSGLILEGKKRGADFRGKKHQIVRTGQFVISSSGLEERLWGVVPQELDEAIVHRSYLCFSIHPALNVNYFAAYLATNQFNMEVSEASTRTGRLSLKQFTNIMMPYPPSEDQQRIAKIWEYTISAHQRSAEEYRSVIQLKSDVAADLFRNLNSTGVTSEQSHKDRQQLLNSMIGIMSNSDLDSQFLYYYLETQESLPRAVNNFSQYSLESAIETLPLALPTIYEQRKIVSLLQQHDEALHKLEVEQNELHHLTQGIMELIFSGDLPSQEALSLLQSS